MLVALREGMGWLEASLTAVGARALGQTRGSMRVPWEVQGKSPGHRASSMQAATPPTQTSTPKPEEPIPDTPILHAKTLTACRCHADAMPLPCC